MYNSQEQYTKIDCEEFRDRLPIIRQRYLETHKNTKGDTTEAEQRFRDEILPYAAKIAQTYDIYLPRLLEVNWKDPQIKTILTPEEVKLEEKPSETTKQRISPHEIREQLLKRRGVRLGLVDVNEGAER